MPANKSVQRYLGVVNDPTKILGLEVNKHTPTPGSFIPKADAQTAPKLSFIGADGSKTYLAVCLDLDAPFQSLPILGPILHWIQPGFKVIVPDGGKLETSSPTMVDYIGPAPPPPSGPHRYVFLLYEQPVDFDAAKFISKGQKISTWSRVRFDWDAWERRAGLFDPVAVNYFTSN